MTEYYLRFTKKPDNEESLHYDTDISIDVIGDIYTNPEYEENGDVIKEPVKLDGWHVNIICEELPDALKQYEVFPENPYRVWL